MMVQANAVNLNNAQGNDATPFTPDKSEGWSIPTTSASVSYGMPTSHPHPPVTFKAGPNNSRSGLVHTADSSAYATQPNTAASSHTYASLHSSTPGDHPGSGMLNRNGKATVAPITGGNTDRAMRDDQQQKSQSNTHPLSSIIAGRLGAQASDIDAARLQNEVLCQQLDEQRRKYIRSREVARSNGAAALPAVPPVSSTGFRTGHHAFIPKAQKRLPGPTRKVHSGRDARSTSPLLVNAPALLRTAGLVDGKDEDEMQAAYWDIYAPAAGRGGSVSGISVGPGAWGGASSVGDLEALDTILDQLVVLDLRMREALLKGPQVSFETVVSDRDAQAGLMMQGQGGSDEEDHIDHTFITSVKGVVEEGAGGAQDAEQFEQRPTSGRSQQQDLLDQQQYMQETSGDDVDGQGLSQKAHVGWAAPTVISAPRLPATFNVEDPGLMALRAAIPVPIMPKLARLYISSKSTASMKAAPPPPPTAAWLLRTRLPNPAAPGPLPSAAPSYDALVTQIKDVQRQYTCGTSRDKAVQAAYEARAPVAPKTNLDLYISGLDGPPLEVVVAPQLGPGPLDRIRPSFVSMQRAAGDGPRSGRRGQMNTYGRDALVPMTSRALPKGSTAVRAHAGPWEGMADVQQQYGVQAAGSLGPHHEPSTTTMA